MIIKDNICVGTGFSAFILKLLLRKKIFFISSNHKIIEKYYDYKRRRNLESHIKIFSKKFKSFGKINFIKNSNILLHDTLIKGGNTNYWGGFINTEKLNKKFFDISKKNNIQLKKINSKKSDYLSSSNNIYQLCDSNDEILDVSNKFKNCLEGHVTHFKVIKKNSLIEVFYYKDNKIHSIFCRKLFLSLGIVQLLELLLNSDLLKKKDIFFLNEYKSKFQLSFNKNIINNSNFITIKYSIGVALKHFFGMSGNYFKFLNYYFKIYIDQFFFNKKQKLTFKIINNNFIKINIPKSFFGKSIHYCDFHVNKINIQKFLNGLSSNIYGISMPFVKQKKPGPISNDIINNIFKILDK